MESRICPGLYFAGELLDIDVSPALQFPVGLDHRLVAGGRWQAGESARCVVVKKSKLDLLWRARIMRHFDEFSWRSLNQPKADKYARGA